MNERGDGLPKRRPASLTVTVLIRTERADVTGQAAEALALLAAYADRLNGIPVGRAVIDFAHGRVKIDLTESLPSVRLAPPTDEN